MSPTLNDGDMLIFSSKKKIKPRSVVLFSYGELEYVKRVSISPGHLNLSGDNSTESREFLDVDPSLILGVLTYPQI